MANLQGEIDATAVYRAMAAGANSPVYVQLASLFHAGPGHVRSGVPAWLEFREAV